MYVYLWEMGLLSSRFHACKSSRECFVSGSVLYLVMKCMNELFPETSCI